MMNFEYGQEVEETTIDSLGSTLKIIRKVHGGIVSSQVKQLTVRIKVYSDSEAKTETENFYKTINDKAAEGVLIVKDSDPSYLPCIMIDRPQGKHDGSYFIIKRWTELSI